MSRLLIIGSQSGLSVFGVIDSGCDVAREVRAARPGIVVLDGVTDGNRTAASRYVIRSGLLSDSLADGNPHGIVSTDKAAATEAPTVHGWPSAGERGDHAQ